VVPEALLPRGGHLGGDVGPGVAAAGVVVAEGGPFGGGVAVGPCGRAVGGSLDEALLGGGRLGWLGVGGEGVEAVEFRLVVARAGVGRGVNHAVRRHDAVEARAANPVVVEPLVLLDVVDLYAHDGREQESAGGPPGVAALVDVEGADGVSDVGEFLARLEAVGGERSDIGALEDPDFAADDVEVLEAEVSGAGLAPHRPEHVAVAGRDCEYPSHGGVDDLVVEKDDPGAAVAGVDQFEFGGWGFPQLLAGPPVEGDHARAVVEAHHAVVRHQGHRHDGDLEFPEDVAAVGLDGHEDALAAFAVPAVGGVGAPALDPAVGVLLVVVTHLPLRVHRGEDDAVGDDQFEGRRRAFVLADDLARGRIEAEQVLADARGQIDAVAHGHQSAREPARAGLEREEMVPPVPQGPLPQDDAVEGVAGGQVVFGGELDRLHEPLVHYVEDPARGRDHCGHARGVFVAAGPEGAAGPTQAAGVAGHRVVRDGRALGVVEVVGPLVEFLRPGLDQFLPGRALLDEGHAPRAQDTHHLGHRQAAGLLDDQDVHQVVDIGQVLAIEEVGADLARDAAREEKLARLADLCLVGVEALDDEGAAAPEFRGSFPISAAQVDDQAAREAGGPD